MQRELEKELKELKFEIKNSFGNFIGYSILAIFGKLMQYQPINKFIEYNFLTGHLADFSSSAAMTSLGYTMHNLVKKNRVTKYDNIFANFFLLTYPISYTLIEFFDKNQTYDPKDVLAYWLGFGVGILTTKLSKRIFNIKDNNRLENKLI